MNIKDIYEAFDKIGSLTFATISNGVPTTRIAHLRAYDDEGIYFMTMFTKQFYKQLKQSGTVSVCGLSADSTIVHDENGFPVFKPGYTIRMSGTVKEVSIDEIKAKNNPIFDFCIKDQEVYPAMAVFCISSASGDIFDYDFEKKSRENKIERTFFAFNGAEVEKSGLTIDKEKCISCGFCKKKCSFLAVKEEQGTYCIDSGRCDECGDCYMVCPANAISHRGI